MTKRCGSNIQTYFDDRRCGQDRRKYLYSIHIPERRKGADRRSMKDRRSFLERRKTFWQIINKREKRQKEFVKSER
jgi:hypothetical protein